MSINYKGIELNSPGDPAPWATIEQDAYKAVIDAIVIDTVSGSASDAKVNGHKHFKLYAETTGDLVLSIDSAQKATFGGDVQFDSGLIVPAATTPGFVKNDGSGNFTFGNVAESVPGGSDSNIQINTGGAFDGSSRAVISSNDLILRDASISNTVRLSSETGQLGLDYAGDTLDLSVYNLSTEQNFTLKTNGVETGIFLDGFTNNTITGWYKPATMSLASVTTFNINAAGVAFFIKKGTYPYTYVLRLVPIQNNIPANFGLPGREIHIFVDESGTVLQQSSVTSTDLLTKCYLGNLTKNGAGDEISFETNQEPVCDSITETARVLIILLGGIQVANMFVGGAGLGTLEISRTAGEVIRIGIEGATDRAEPDTILVAAESPIATLSYRYSDENSDIQFYSNDTEIDPTQWYNKSTTALVNVTSNNWSGQRVYYFAASAGGTATTIVMLGNAQFNTSDDATAAMGGVDEDFSKPQALKRAVFLGWVICRGGASNADSMSDVQYVPFNDPFELSRTGSGSSSGGSATMQSTYNSSTIPQIITDVTRGAVTYRRGSAADTDNVLVVQNGAAGEVASIKGSGYVQAMRVGAGVSPAELLHVSDGDNVVAKVQATDVGSTASIVMSNDSIEFSHSVAGVNDTYRFRDETSGKDRYYLDASGHHTFVGESTVFKSDITSSNYNLFLQGQDVTHGGAIIGLNSAGSDGPLEFYTGSNLRARIDEADGTLSVGPNAELILYPQTIRPANGLPAAQLLIAADNWSVELGATSETMRIGKVSPAGTDSMSFGVIGSGTLGSIGFDAEALIVDTGTTKGVYQDLVEVTPSFRSFRYEYNDIVGPVTVNNRLQFNNADPGLATKMYVDFDPLDKPSSVESILENIKDDSIVYIFHESRTVDQWMEIKITNTILQTGYTEYDITVTKKQGATWANTTTIAVNIYDPVGSGGGGSSVTDAFFAEPTGTMAMANGVTVVPNMNNEVYDDNNVYDLGANTFTAQTEGVHVITAATKVSVSAGGQIESYLYVNGILTCTASGSIDTAGTMVANAAITIGLEIGDTVQLRAAQFTGFAGTMQISETFISGHTLPLTIP